MSNVFKRVVVESERVAVEYVFNDYKGMFGYFVITNKTTNKRYKCGGETRTQDAMRHADNAHFGYNIYVWEYAQANNAR
jgi:hypothetical protein